MDISFQRSYGPELLRRKGTANNSTAVEQMWVAERAYRSGRGFSPLAEHGPLLRLDPDPIVRAAARRSQEQMAKKTAASRATRRRTAPPTARLTPPGG